MIHPGFRRALPRLPRALPALALATALLAGCATPGQAPSSPTNEAPVRVKVLAINDFHGNLLPPAGGIRIADPARPGETLQVQAGGAEYLASAVQSLRAKNPHHVFVAAGDLVGASPLLSALFHDEPTIEALGLMGLELSAVGNHEFDEGLAELQRKQNGGCHPGDGCKGPKPFEGARYRYLAASTVDERNGQTVFPAYAIKRFDGVPMAFIGLTLKGTPGLVSPSGVRGLRFEDEVQTVNRLVPELQRQGVQAIAVLIHEGGYPTGGHNECPGISGPIVDIVERLDPAVDLVISGHTHRAYVCRIAGRLVTSGDKFGTLVSEIDVELDRRSGDVRSVSAGNVIVQHDRFAKDAQQTALIAGYQQVAGPLIHRHVGRIAASFDRDETRSPGGGTAMGQLVADAMLAATAPADQGAAELALTNIGGVRTGLVLQGDGSVSYGDLFAALPFGNALVTVELSGAQLLQVLEEQWRGQPKFRPLQVSRGFAYTWDPARPVGQRVLPDSVTLNGEPLRAERRYRVAINAFLQAGGDGYATLTQGQAAVIGPRDVDALEAFVKAQPGPLQPSSLDRVRRR
ncbi:bifunctional metallophosphatase/5'-nucleotidase [Pelomonas sp. CA6]|uniref:bifunctional metallophosphatase/5'-nucleotidase n=1 Tax=Pelomonas sp. CA6 TaxID=2907999 RepID=UPI001F4C3B93|nr:bifunctional metallophosphatase/5'-nucleotidase [Pelomonas sp. CA6]MCH7344929.1 bifunctional metallophosphatase/5'-nucleotidase [Pelomonas sp. CA6]